MADNIQADGIEQVPDLKPIDIPGRDLAPSLDDRVTEIESVLKIN